MINPKIILTNNSKGKGVIAAKNISEGELILEFEKNFVKDNTDHNTEYRLRLDENLFQISVDPENIENFINHSCDPNSFVNYELLELRALRNIKKDEEICFNYFTCDWENEDTFECRCDSSKCRKIISGFKHLPLEEKLKIKNHISPYIAKKFSELTYPKEFKYSRSNFIRKNKPSGNTTSLPLRPSKHSPQVEKQP